MRYFTLLVIAIVGSLSAFSQAQTNNWFFTNNGISFSSGNPMNITGGQVIVSEGASAVSDKNGQLLFYTDGITVWTKNHGIMQNGQGLAGGTGSSTQSSLIIPKTADEKQYYIFTTDEEGAGNGFQYSVVDLTQNGGLGAVIQKNQLLVTPCSEKVTATLHCNKKDYWVITHKYNSDAYYAYLATENGVNPTPVISHTGSFIPITYATMAGAIRASPDGRKIVAMQPGIGIELSDFNNLTGVISNTHEIFNNENGIHYGADFSKSSKMLYVQINGYWHQPDVMRHSGLFQYDVSLPTIADIINSKFEVYRLHQPNDGSTVQRGPDGKIYVSNYRKNYLSVVNSPEMSGAGCNYVDVGFQLTNNAMASLPNFLSDYGTLVDTFSITSLGTCVNVPINYNYTPTGTINALQWDFGDPGSGSQNTSTSANPSHIYTAGGNYTVKLIKYSPCGTDTIKKSITIGDLQVSLGNDTSICENSQYLITSQVNSATSYLWQNGSMSPTFLATTSGTYWLQVSNNSNGCIKRDSIIITGKPLPTVHIGKDTSICTGSSLLLDALNPGSTYLWQNGTTNQTMPVNQSGLYWVKVTSNGCNFTDSIRITEFFKPQFTLGPDQSICTGQQIKLQVSLQGASYQWQNGSSNSTLDVFDAGIYFVDVTNQCGTVRDSIVIGKTDCNVYVPTAFTPNNDGKNDHFKVLGTGNVTEFELHVYNRWGQVVFKTKDKSKGWNGTLNSLPQPGSIYIWTLTFKMVTNTNAQFMKGTVVLVR